MPKIKKSSKYDQFFIKKETSGICRLCSKVVAWTKATGTNGVRGHLWKSHRNVWHEFMQKESNSKQSNKQAEESIITDKGDPVDDGDLSMKLVKEEAESSNSFVLASESGGNSVMTSIKEEYMESEHQERLIEDETDVFNKVNKILTRMGGPGNCEKSTSKTPKGEREQGSGRSGPPSYRERIDLCPPPYVGKGYSPYGQKKPIPPMSPMREDVVKVAKEFISFLNRSVTPFHAVQECKNMLKSAGFLELQEHGSWTVQPGHKYFVTKNRSAIIAFAVGGAYKPGNGFSIVVGHTDSPCLRVKPVSKQKSANFNQVGVTTYGGGIWRTWFDRDLCVAGEVVYKTEKGVLSRKLINIDRPVLFIPNLAIHLETDRETFKCNKEDHLRPVLESAAAAVLRGDVDKEGKELGVDGTPVPAPNGELEPTDCTGEHHVHFLQMIADTAGVPKDDIVDMDLYLYDSQPAAVTGMHEEFISGARLDNLVGTYTAVRGLIDSLADGSLGSEEMVRMAACYDNEEVGSDSQMGAASAYTEHILRRLAAGGDPIAFEQAIGKSMLISADQAHACHPNYASKHEENHRPKFHGGVVVKVNVNQRYATTSTTHAVLKEIALQSAVPLQKMIVRNDSPCGSTVGPILSTKLGLQTVDVGCPQLAMHSIREFADTSSILQAITLYKTFHQRLQTVLHSLL